MKKSTVKLVIHREAIRVLAALDLARGGDPNAALGTGGPETGCPLVPRFGTEGANTTCVVVPAQPAKP